VCSSDLSDETLAQVLTEAQAAARCAQWPLAQVAARAIVRAVADPDNALDALAEAVGTVTGRKVYWPVFDQTRDSKAADKAERARAIEATAAERDAQAHVRQRYITQAEAAFLLAYRSYCAANPCHAVDRVSR